MEQRRWILPLQRLVSLLSVCKLARIEQGDAQGGVPCVVSKWTYSPSPECICTMPLQPLGFEMKPSLIRAGQLPYKLSTTHAIGLILLHFSPSSFFSFMLIAVSVPCGFLNDKCSISLVHISHPSLFCDCTISTTSNKNEESIPAGL